jgi:multiple sugar transport system substrate-binding protein
MQPAGRHQPSSLSRRGFLGGTLGLAAAAVAGCGTAVRSDPFAGQSTRMPRHRLELAWMCQELPRNAGGDCRFQLADAFTREYPNVSIRLIQVPDETDVRRTALTAQIASGAEVPDVYLGDVVWPAQFADSALAAPLGRWEDDRRFWSDFPSAVVESLRYRGNMWAYPVYVDEAFLYYRTDLLEQAGFTPPTTWEELADIGRRLVRDGTVRYGFVWQADASETLTCNVSEFVADAGGAFLDPTGTSVVAGSPETRRAVSFMTELVRDGVSPRAVSTFAEDEASAAFLSGQAAFMRNWSYAWGEANDPELSQVAGRVGVVPRPRFAGSGRERLSTLGGWHAFVNPHSVQPGAALTFARWLAGPTAQRILATQTSYTPARTSVLLSDEVAGQDNPTFRLAADTTFVNRPTASPYYPQISKAIYTHVNPLIASGGGDVDAAVSGMADRIQQAKDGLAL